MASDFTFNDHPSIKQETNNETSAINILKTDFVKKPRNEQNTQSVPNQPIQINPSEIFFAEETRYVSKPPDDYLFNVNESTVYTQEQKNAVAELIKKAKHDAEKNTPIFFDIEDSINTIVSESTDYIVETIDKEEKDNSKKFINGVSIIFKKLTQEKHNEEVKKLPQSRKYTNNAVFEKVNYAKPVVKKESFVGGLIKLTVVCLIIALFFGVQANSYCAYKNANIDDTLSCMWLWATVENLPITLTPLYTDVFSSCFFTALFVSAIVGAFMWIEKDQMKKSRVGHEHGNARLGTKSDFKKFKRKFMSN